MFLHVGAANYRSYFWVNGKDVCPHEGGFTAFDCEATQALHDGSNFVVAAVDNTRLVSGVPTVNTDWWNYGGLTRDVSLVEVPWRRGIHHGRARRRGGVEGASHRHITSRARATLGPPLDDVPVPAQ